MNRIMFVIASLAVIAGLAVVHFSLVDAQPESFPSATGHPTDTPTPTITPVVQGASLFVQKPERGPVGTEVRVSGHNFDPFQSVSITFDGQLVALANANSAGFFTQVTFMVPDVLPGNYQVVVGTISLPFIVTTTIDACFKNHKTDAEKQGQLRIVSDPAKCRKNETPISWDQP